LVSDDELDRINPTEHGREKGQIDGTPEDGGLLLHSVILASSDHVEQSSI
jgi:hypothetical protein